MSKFTDWFRGLGQKINNTKLGAFFKNWQDSGKVLPPAVGGVAESLLNKYTDAGATGRDVAINNMNRQNIVDEASLEVEGYKKAGVNPALMYGSGTSSAPTVSNSSSGGLQDLVGLMALPAQLENLRTNSRKQAEETRTEVERRKKVQQETANLKQSLNNLLAEEGLTQAKEAEIRKALEWTDRINEASLGKIESERKLNESQKKQIDDLLEGQKMQQIYTLADFYEKWDLMRAEARKMAKESDLLEKDIENYMINRLDSGFMGTGLSLSNLIKFAFGFKGDGKAPSTPESKQKAKGYENEYKGDTSKIPNMLRKKYANN